MTGVEERKRDSWLVVKRFRLSILVSKIWEAVMSRCISLDNSIRVSSSSVYFELLAWLFICILSRYFTHSLFTVGVSSLLYGHRKPIHEQFTEERERESSSVWSTSSFIIRVLSPRKCFSLRTVLTLQQKWSFPNVVKEEEIMRWIFIFLVSCRLGILARVKSSPLSCQALGQRDDIMMNLLLSPSLRYSICVSKLMLELWTLKFSERSNISLHLLTLAYSNIPFEPSMYWWCNRVSLWYQS